MIIELFYNLGAWGWLLVGLVLLTVEILVPGYFFLWLGSAATLVGIIGLLGLQSTGWWTPAMQFVAFGLLSIAATFIGRQFYDPRDTASQEPLLNQRAAQLIGQKATLIEPMMGGTGRARVGDTIWRVEGPDADAGTVMIVTAAKDHVLTIAL